jgi:hypothetical protein
MSQPREINGKKNKNLPRIGSHRIIFGLVIMILIVGCATTSVSNSGNNIQPQPSDTKPLSKQIIIKFRADGLDPSTPAFIEQLSRDAAAPLVYLRPMSGGAHVFGLKNIADTARMKEIVGRLKERPDILYVEKDAILQHQKGKR